MTTFETCGILEFESPRLASGCFIASYVRFGIFCEGELVVLLVRGFRSDDEITSFASQNVLRSSHLISSLLIEP